MNMIILNEVFLDLFDILYIAVILTTIFVVILDNRNPVKTMAWILVLFFLPLIGLVFYFFFGRSTRKERLISKKGYSRLSKRPMAAYQAQVAYRDLEEKNTLLTFFLRINKALPSTGIRLILIQMLIACYSLLCMKSVWLSIIFICNSIFLRMIL